MQFPSIVQISIDVKSFFALLEKKDQEYLPVDLHDIGLLQVCANEGMHRRLPS